jgi:hypothetical protein
MFGHRRRRELTDVRVLLGKNGYLENKCQEGNDLLS